MKKLALLVNIILALSGFTTSKSHIYGSLISYDKDTKYGIEYHNDGFSVAVSYSQYQIIPESNAVAIACKNQLITIAQEYADRVGKEIEQINEQKIRITHWQRLAKKWDMVHLILHTEHTTSGCPN